MVSRDFRFDESPSFNSSSVNDYLENEPDDYASQPYEVQENYQNTGLPEHDERATPMSIFL